MSGAIRPLFCQMLVGQGHRIIHSSRHSQIELGKDVISLAPDGVPCAYQLKGNPGTRLTLTQFQQMLPQLLQLVNMPIPVDSLVLKSHRSYLVTNGLVEEETHFAIRELNSKFAQDGFPNRQLDILQRGELLKMASDLGHSLWPSEFEEVHLIVELLVEKGNDKFPVPKLHDLLVHMLGLQEDSHGKMKAGEMRRRVTSAAVLVAVALRNFQHKENHWAIISAWVLYCAYVVAACERHKLSFAKNGQAAVELALTTIRDTLISLAGEVFAREWITEGDLMVDSVAYKARYTLLLSLLSILWFWCEKEGWPDSVVKTRVMEFLSAGTTNPYLWGEAAIPQILCYYWYLRATNASSNQELILAQILRRISDHRLIEQFQGLPQPYYDFEDVARHALVPILGRDQDPLGDEYSGSMSYFAESLMHLLVRTGRKQACKSVWPDLTRTEFISFVPDSKWRYCLWRVEGGRYIEVQPPLTKNWDELVAEARHIDCPDVPEAMSRNKFLHALFLILLPYRATPAVIRAVARRFDDTWFIPEPITGQSPGS